LGTINEKRVEKKIPRWLFWRVNLLLVKEGLINLINLGSIYH
jgi:hypothetical protein